MALCPTSSSPTAGKCSEVFHTLNKELKAYETGRRETGTFLEKREKTWQKLIRQTLPSLSEDSQAGVADGDGS